jgi:alkylhydroperoxidase family enzyme
VPLATIPPEAESLLRKLGGAPNNVHRVLANHPALLQAWIQFVYSLRAAGMAPPRFRELVILRVAAKAHSSYEWEHHRSLAASAGIDEAEIAGVRDWPAFHKFSKEDQLALRLADAVSEGDLPQALLDEVLRTFGTAVALELVVTAGFYVMVAHLISWIEIPLERDP